MGDVYKTKVVKELKVNFEIRIVHYDRETRYLDDSWYEIQQKIAGEWQIVTGLGYEDYFTSLELAEKCIEKELGSNFKF